MKDYREIQKILENHERRISQLEKLINKGSKRGVRQKRSIMDLIIELKEEGFYKQCKFLREIADELCSRGYNYKLSSLTAPLQRALRNGIIRRIKKDGKWAYVAR